MASLDLDTSFDYVVVGGGTAGSVVASRLSEDENVRVVVIEAGPDHSTDPLVLIPGLAAAQYGQEQYDWNFTSVPQPHLNNRRVNQCRGRQLGGSSALNFMLALYPSKANIDAWKQLGNPGWSYDVLAPYLRKFSTVHPPSASAKSIMSMSRYHDEDRFPTGDGPVQISFGEGFTPELHGAWIKTFSNLGLGMTADPRTGKAIGGFQNPAKIDPTTHTRSWAASAYLSPEVRNRPNLVILTETLVKKIILEKENDEAVATGVIIQHKDGSEKTIYARLEVVLAAGALQSPQILELSGIGSRQLLEKHGIPVVVDNPNVGENLQDHPMVCQNFEVQDGIPSGDAILRDPSIVNTLLEMYTSTAGAGPLGQSNISVAYAPLADHRGPVTEQDRKTLLDKHFRSFREGTATSRQYDFQRSLTQQSDEPTAEYLLFPMNGEYPDEPKSLADILTTARSENFITIMTVLNHPFSRGSVHIASPDVNVKPIWDPNYMAEPLDLEIMARNIQFVEKIVSTEPFSSTVLKRGGVRLPDIVADDVEKAKEIINQRQLSIFHVCGSCAMLPEDEGGVVDERLRVYKTKNIRVVDASIFPLEPLGNILATVYAVAERAADIMARDRKAYVPGE